MTGHILGTHNVKERFNLAYGFGGFSPVSAAFEAEVAQVKNMAEDSYSLNGSEKAQRERWGQGARVLPRDRICPPGSTLSLIHI